jgi:hypothetical protein
MTSLRKSTLAFIDRHRLPEAGVGAYRYSLAVEAPTLYASAYAAMTRSLYNDLDGRRQAWIDHFARHQDDDGLFRDPVIFDQGWYAGDPLWCGRAHLTCHVVKALACLGAASAKPIAFVEPYCDTGFLGQWLESRDWAERVAWTGNEIMNVGTLLQYERDFHANAAAGRAVGFLLDWLDTHWIDADTGVWGDLDVSDPINRSHAVQAAYHWWPLYFHDGRPVPHAEAAIDTLLATQNAAGGFGCGVHNPAEPQRSSACEDIDSIDPLVWISRQADHRRDDVRAALGRVLGWVLRNQMADGGFVFILDQPFEYGHPQLHGARNAGAMFPTWFRTLSLATLARALPDSWIGRYPWQWTCSPGFQFKAPCGSSLAQP